jgi:predicted  nucleic acid-binding Zn-ribbon protein
MIKMHLKDLKREIDEAKKIRKYLSEKNKKLLNELKINVRKRKALSDKISHLCQEFRKLKEKAKDENISFD